MSKQIKLLPLSVLAAGVLMATGCDGASRPTAPESATMEPQRKQLLLPASDPTNTGNWVLNQDISDEFSGDSLDRSKWFVQGENGDYYIWKGRAPSQFAPHNVYVEGGMLKITSRWEPDYSFAVGEGHEGNFYGVHEGQKVPVTTGAVVSKKRFLNGYMEVRSKAADAAMTSSFWAIGYQQELDIYEQMGRPTLKGDVDIKGNTLKASVHDWQPPAVRPTRKFGHKTDLSFNVAEEFHVYGAEWGEDYLKFYLDGKLVHEVTQEEVGEHWVLTNPMEIWLDSEIFVWQGLPTEDQLPATYEIDYVRVWQKPESNLLDRAFFGFEGPILYEQENRPLNLVPENSENNKYQKFWLIDEQSAQSLQRVRNERFAKGTWSLKYTGGKNTKATAIAPENSVNLLKGNYRLSAKIWVEPYSTADKVSISLNSTDTPIAEFDLQSLARGEWIKVYKEFDYPQSLSGDFMKISITDQENGSGVLYIDDIAIEKE
ncbi:family 16 glycosylhydrolase [Microbulbifer thermotolerans]|uniref:family 16 glycosylhydrolase n=1 Tax=Microbulbifer thermotolerans TaxID=252514 RepID=UPI0008EA951A|nr:family 16 glycosylhydrolase [Microbulbifer thermotolerans]MCX2784082.1 family 16 glycosylhydrolase [Microbulbifer thermotolerans]SFC76005.1 Glycosyl hydrolases family 16 [Microbulbifer thermotolerans]